MTNEEELEDDDDVVEPGDTLFTAENGHDDDAPTVLWEDVRYRAYFQNEFGEQWILFHYDLELNTAVILTGGDIGWDEHLFEIEALREPIVKTELILRDSERAWLTACLTAVRAYVYPDDHRPVVIVSKRKSTPARK